MWKEINYIYIALSLNKFVLPSSPITVNFSKYEKASYFLYKGKKAYYSIFYEYEWFLDSSIFAYFTLFESDFIDITLGNYG